MLLKSLIGQLQTDAGTPGTPDENHGVPDTTPHEPKPHNDLARTEHREHQEHHKTIGDEVKSRNRTAIAAEIRALYSRIGRHSKADLARWEAARPGFKAAWHRLEHAFSSAWSCGQDCGLEMEALRLHFKEVLNVR